MSESKGVRARVAGSMNLDRVGAAAEDTPLLVYKRAAAKLGMEPDKEYLLTAVEIEPNWPVVLFSENTTPWLYCGHCGTDLGRKECFTSIRCKRCHVALVGEVPQSRVAELLRQEGGAR